jgi:hypothetical protein
MGEAIALLVLGMWLVLLWLGWSIIFASDPDAVLLADTDDPAGLVDRVYFAGFSLFTLGVGDVHGGSGWWRLSADLAALNGLFLVTVAVSYVLSVTSAVADRRGTAAIVSGLGLTGRQIVLGTWDGQRLSGLEAQLAQLAPQLARIAEQHLAKPVLHFFHSAERHTALEPSIVALHDALLLLEYGIAEHVRPSLAALRSTDAAVERIFQVYGYIFRARTHELLEPPDLEPLRDAGIPTVDDDEYEAALELLRERRGQASSLLAESGWGPEAVRA